MSKESATLSGSAPDANPAEVSLSISGAPRGWASWSGLLRLSLVAVPVKAYPAVSTSDKVHFNQLHADCGQRINYQKCCPVHGQVDAAAIARGYQYAPGHYVVIEPAELEPLRPAKEKALLLEQFVEPSALDPVMFSGRTLYLLPDGLAAQHPYLVLTQAMQQRGVWGLGRVTLSGTRQLVLIRPAGRLLAVDVLHYPAEVRSRAGLEAELSGRQGSDEELRLADQLIQAASGSLDWHRYRDDTAEKIRALIEAKIEGRPVEAQADEPVQIVQLLDALRQSVAAAGGPSATVHSASSKPAVAKKASRRRSA